MRKLALLSALLPTLLAGAADAKPAFEVLEVALWPEFDRAAMLVMYRGRLAPETKLPAQVQIALPAAAGEPNAVAMRGENGTLFSLPFERQVKGAWETITLTTDAPEIQVEAYLPITMEGSSRRFAYEWPGGLAVGELRYEVQRPVGATEVRVSPAPSREAQQADRLTYYYGTLGPLLASQRGVVELRYTKSDAQLSAHAASPAESAPGSAPEMTTPSMPATEAREEPSAAPPAPTNPALWLVSGGLVVGVLLAIAWWMQSMRRSPKP